MGYDATMSYGADNSLNTSATGWPVNNVNDQLNGFLGWYRQNVRPQELDPPQGSMRPPGGRGAVGQQIRHTPPGMTMGRQGGDVQGQLQALQLQKLRQEMQMQSAKPSDFGQMRADRYGNWGTFVDPKDIPAALQGTIMGGQYGDISNWDSSNPMITGPQQFGSGKYRT